MTHTARPLFLAILATIGSAAQLVRAGDNPEPPPDAEEPRIPEVFSSHLPATQPKNSLRVSLHPHLGDLARRDELRLSAGLRYGLTQRWEAALGTTFYLSHGRGDTRFGDRVGFSDIRLSTKLNIGRFPIRRWSSAVGVDFLRPVGAPPADITDGFQRLAPYATFSLRLPNHPSVRLFWGTGFELVEHVVPGGRIADDKLSDDSNFLTGGFVIDRGRLHYTFEAKAATTRLLGHNSDDLLTLRPGIIWEIPWGENSRWSSKWYVGGSLRATFGPDRTSLGGGAKLRIEFDPKRWRRAKEIPRGEKNMW